MSLVLATASIAYKVQAPAILVRIVSGILHRYLSNPNYYEPYDSHPYSDHHTDRRTPTKQYNLPQLNDSVYILLGTGREFTECNFRNAR
jgi:hypothetical protein